MQQSTACSPCTPYWGTVTLDTETGEYTEELGSETGEYSEELESETGEFTEELERADQRNTDKKMNHKGGGGDGRGDGRCHTTLFYFIAPNLAFAQLHVAGRSVLG